MTDRATFEAHFGLTLRQQQRHKDDRYTDPITQARWEGWQARDEEAQEAARVIIKMSARITELEAQAAQGKPA